MVINTSDHCAIITSLKKRKKRAKLLFTDTDDLIYQIETEDVYEDFYVGKNFFDFSNYYYSQRFMIQSTDW